MLSKQYQVDREFSLILELSGGMDEQMAIVDRLLCDRELFKLIETDLSKHYPLSTATATATEDLFSTMVVKFVAK